MSPAGKSGPLAKRPASRAATTGAPASRRGAPAAAAPASASAPALADEGLCWEAVAEETGWNVEDCLAHKMSFAKRADPKGKVQALATHVKRLRAAGRHLADAWQHAAAHAEALAGRLAREEAARGVEREAHDAALRGVQGELGALGEAMRQREQELGERQAQVRRGCSLGSGGCM